MSAVAPLHGPRLRVSGTARRLRQRRARPAGGAAREQGMRPGDAGYGVSGRRARSSMRAAAASVPLERGAYERFYAAVVAVAARRRPRARRPCATAWPACACSTPPAPSAASRSSHRVERNVMKTSLGIWAFGPMVTRFVPGGYQPEHDYQDEPTAEKVARAVAGLGDLIDGYEFHYPQELSDDNLDEVRAGARRARHLLHRHGPAPRPALRQGRPDRRPTPACAARRCEITPARRPTSPATLGAHLIIWPGIEGYNYPFQTPYARALGLADRGHRRGGRALQRARRHGSSSSTRTPSPR